MYIIESGRAQVELETPIVLEKGDYFGEMGLVNNNPRTATITTLEEVKLLQLKKEDLEELFDEHPVLFQAIEAKLEAINSQKEQENSVEICSSCLSANSGGLES